MWFDSIMAMHLNFLQFEIEFENELIFHNITRASNNEQVDYQKITNVCNLLTNSSVLFVNNGFLRPSRLLSHYSCIHMNSVFSQHRPKPSIHQASMIINIEMLVTSVRIRMSYYLVVRFHCLKSETDIMSLHS